MLRTICKAKIHGVTITQTKLDYEGSITIPVDVIRKANILPYERVQIVNLNNGARFETFVISGPKGSGTICLNGPSARLSMVGDQIHIISYALLNDEEIDKLKVKLVYLNDRNKVKQTKEFLLKR